MARLPIVAPMSTGPYLVELACFVGLGAAGILTAAGIFRPCHRWLGYLGIATGAIAERGAADPATPTPPCMLSVTA